MTVSSLTVTCKMFPVHRSLSSDFIGIKLHAVFLAESLADPGFPVGGGGGGGTNPIGGPTLDAVIFQKIKSRIRGRAPDRPLKSAKVVLIYEILLISKFTCQERPGFKPHDTTKTGPIRGSTQWTLVQQFFE